MSSPAKTSTVWRFLDLEAEHTDDDGEGDIDEEQEWESFFGDNKDLASEDQYPTDPPRRELAEAAEDAGALERLAQTFRPGPRNARIVPDTLVASQDLPLQVTAPHMGDPGLCFNLTRAQTGHEREAVSQLAHKCLGAITSRSPSIVSAFNRDGIGGHIFIEAPSLPDVVRALKGMALARPARSSLPRPIEVDRRIELLTSPAPQRLNQTEGGCWIRLNRGLHRGDFGFVYSGQGELDDRLGVLVVPRVPRPESAAGPWTNEMGHNIPQPKRRKLGRPPARPLTVSEALAVYGQECMQVYDMARDIFLCGETLFYAGVARYFAPRHCMDPVDEMPSNLGPFVRASTGCKWTMFNKWLVKAAQGATREGMRIVVVRGGLKGLVGHVTSILNDTVSILGSFAPGNARSYSGVGLSDTLPHFMPGDSVKERWSLSRGVVIKVGYSPDELVYVDQNHREVTTHTYEVELHSPELHAASLRPGVWVNYVGVPAPEDAQVEGYKRIRVEGYGCILANDGEAVYVKDYEKHGRASSPINNSLGICSWSPGSPLPQQTGAPVPPLMPELLHKEVIVLSSHLRGRTGTVRGHTVYGASVILHTDLAVNAANTRWFSWDQLLVRMLPASPPRGRTATPEPGSDREATPPPRDQPQWYAPVCERAEDHWIHWRQVQEIMATKRLAMAIREPNGSPGKSAKTVPLLQRTLQPGAGEVVVSTVPAGRRLPRQASIDPRELVQRPAALGDNVLVTDGRWLGWVGKLSKPTTGQNGEQRTGEDPLQADPGIPSSSAASLSRKQYVLPEVDMDAAADLLATKRILPIQFEKDYGAY
ncbi:hypothetical protein BC834DRAFT_847365 [Gloeopeniophorella convolvens]|nr:hypothetical protein BC834DRAFT_847365 [Gloeopeniophorella convolvens]